MAWHIIEIDSHSFAVSDLLTNYLPAHTPCVHGVTLRQSHTDNLGDDNTEEYNFRSVWRWMPARYANAEYLPLKRWTLNPGK